MTNPDSRFKGCGNFNKCYVDKLQYVMPYSDDLDKAIIPKELWKPVNSIVDECLSKFQCGKTLKVNRKQSAVSIWILLGIIAFFMSLVCF